MGKLDMNKKNSKSLVAIIVSATLISGCAELEPLAEYTPVVDMKRTSSAKFENNLLQCRNIALKLEADYKKRQQAELGANLLAGLLVGAALGAAIGDTHESILLGATAGGLSGASSGDYTNDLVKYGPRRVIDRCMSARGHVILNDLGAG